MGREVISIPSVFRQFNRARVQQKEICDAFENMKGYFWAVIIGLAFTVPLLPWMLGNPPIGQMHFPLPLSQKLPYYFAATILVAVIWAILFRRQIESLRISLRSIFALVLMESALLLAVRIANPFWTI
jgi:hypothetical protein